MDTPKTVDQLAMLGAEKVCVSLTLTLYFQASLFDLREGILYCLDDYLGQCGNLITWYADEETGRFQRATPELFKRPARRLSGEDRTTPVSWIFHGGAKQSSLSPVLFEAANTVRGENLRYIRATFPVSWFDGRFQDLANMTRTWSDKVGAFHGYSGFSFNESPAAHVRQANSRLIYALSMLFVGIEVDNPLLTAQCTKDSVKGVNWLTVLGEPFIERLGGEERLRSSLAKGLVVYKYRGGIIIQAGDRPRLGDQNNGEILPEYREVAAALKPLRVTKHFPLGPKELGSFGWEGTEAWLRRFDPASEGERS